jgi:hypothetical protein
MKKLTLLLIAACLFNIQSKAQEKSFQKGRLIISLCANGAFYTDNLHQEQDSSYLSTVTRIAKDKKGQALAGVFPLAVEYGLTNWLGVGVRGAYTKFIDDTDSTYKYGKPKVTTTDFGLTLDFHLVKTVSFDMPIVINAGYSNFTFLQNNSINSTAKATGFNYGIGIQPRIFFSKHFAMFFNIAYSGLDYTKITWSDNNVANYSNVNNLTGTLKASGANLGLGFLVSFL